MTPAALALRDLRKTFNRGLPDSRPALDGVSLDLASGDFVVVIGSNGAGKSTLLNAIAGRYPLDGGQIAVAGRDITGLAEHRRAGLIARVFQDPMAGTAAGMTVAENLALAEQRGRRRRLRPHLDPVRRANYAALLAGLELGLERRLDTEVAQLSGGQRQALSLVMATVSKPALLLLDEHTAALDPRTAALVMAATVASIAAGRLTAIMVTHNMQQAIDYGSRLVMMHAGRIRLDLPAEEKRGLSQDELVRRFHINDDRILLARGAA